MNTDEPFDLRSDEIKKNELNNLFVGIKGTKRTYEGTISIKLYKQTNWNKIINSISIFTAAAARGILIRKSSIIDHNIVQKFAEEIC